MKSIRSTLLIWLSTGLLLGILAIASVLYGQAREEASLLFDYQMKQTAAALPGEFFGYAISGRADAFLPQEDLVIQVWDRSGLRLYYSHDPVELPPRARLGFSTVSTLRDDWRVYSMQHGNAVIQIAQPMRVRRAVAAQFAIKTVLPLLLLIPFAAALIVLTVRRGLAPVRRVAAEVKARDAAALAPVSSAGLPQEILPLTDALNDLLERLNQAIETQRTFVADAAHELRTPLTALKLQMQLAERADSDAERAAAFADLRNGLDRAARLVQQLLTLARQEPANQQPASHEQSLQPLDLWPLVQNAAADFALAAEARQITLAAHHAGEQPAYIRGNADAIAIVLSNLLDNAIRYTPQDGRVVLEVESREDTVTISVQDNGPGIAEDELARVFDRFYRGSNVEAHGSGLGLAIVKRIADLHQATVEAINTQPGLRVTLTFPRSSNPGSPNTAK